MATLWFCLATAVICGYVLLDGFDLGAGIVQLFVPRTECEKTEVLNSIASVWDGNEVWLVAAGGTLFLAFPALYASAFSGFYLALMIALWLLILRGIAIAFSSHVDGELWRRLWSTVFGLASATLAIVFGIALGNVVRGVPLDQDRYFFLPLWTNLAPQGQVGILDWYTLLVGAASYVALAVHGALWVVLKTEGDLQDRVRTFAGKCWVAQIALTVMVTIASFYIQPNLVKQFISHPLGFVFPLIAAAGIVGLRPISSRRRDPRAFLASCLYLLGMLTSVSFGLFPNVLPSNSAASASLTIYNAAAGEHGLMVGIWWFVPGVVVAIIYQVVVYRYSFEKGSPKPIGQH